MGLPVSGEHTSSAWHLEAQSGSRPHEAEATAMWDHAGAHTHSLLADEKTTGVAELLATRGLQTLRPPPATSVLPDLCRSEEANDGVKETNSLILPILGDQLPPCSDNLLPANDAEHFHPSHWQ